MFGWIGRGGRWEGTPDVQSVDPNCDAPTDEPARQPKWDAWSF